ncbi:MAG: hypothetical protein WCH34_03095 [Bacteroidota bacterium]
MKKFITTLIAIFIYTLIRAQVPEAINYQGLARNNSGNIITNHTVSLRLSILSGSVSGTPVYEETHP